MASAFQGDAFQTDAFQSSITISGSFTADAVLLKGIASGFSADAVLLRTQSTSLTADAVLSTSVIISGSFTADAVLLGSQSGSLTANAVLLRSGTASFTANAALRKNLAGSFTADAVLRKVRTGSFTANARKLKTFFGSFSANGVVKTPTVLQHARTGPHTGVDTELAHTVAFAFDRYLRGEALRAVLIDIDARLTARESGARLSFGRFVTFAAIEGSQSHSFSADARIAVSQAGNFTADAVFGTGFQMNAWIIDPAYAIVDDVMAAQTWDIEAGPRAAIISTASLTHDAVNDPDWWDPDYLSGWAKFTLTSTQTVQIDGIGSQGDTVIQLWTGSPGSWPSEPVAFGDDDIEDPLNPYGFSPFIQLILDPGTYYVVTHPFDEPPSPDFILQLRMQIL